MFKHHIYRRALCLALMFFMCVLAIDVHYATAAEAGRVCEATLQTMIDGHGARAAFAEKLGVAKKIWQTTDPRNDHDIDTFMYCVKTHDIERLLHRENAPRYYSLSVVCEDHLATYDNKDIVLLLDFPDEYVELALRQMPDNTQAYNKSSGSFMRFIHDNVRLNHTNVLFWKKGRYVWPAWKKNLIFFILNIVDKRLRTIDKYLLRLECAFISHIDERTEYEQTRRPSFFITIDTALYALAWMTLLIAEWVFGKCTRATNERLIGPATVLRERDNISMAVSHYLNNEVVVTNGPELTIKGVGLVVRSEPDWDLSFTLRRLKAHSELMDHLIEQQLPIVLLPEKGINDIEKRRELVLKTIAGSYEIRPYTFLIRSGEKAIPVTDAEAVGDIQCFHAA
ncbi:MAG: hypothetical protein JW938_04760 [Candidatus Omnitrophica bacterium]|nr:hypothetical protein [Candidatus Omnitrophota bacterium]